MATPPSAASSSSAPDPSAPPASSPAAAAAAADAPDPLPLVDPIAAVQDSIDALALSLFEALRGVRDAVAPASSLGVTGADGAAAWGTAAGGGGGGGGGGGAGIGVGIGGAGGGAQQGPFKDDPDEVEKDASAKERLLHGLNLEHFPPRAFDLQDPDYDAFLLAYLGDDPHARELVERYRELSARDGEGSKPEAAEGGGASAAKDVAEGAEKEATKPPGQETKVGIGDVGYEFRKKFDAGWYKGKVVEIRPLAANGYNRRCVYEDGDTEDLRLEDLERLAKLDPANKKPRLSIKIPAKPDKGAPPTGDSDGKGVPAVPKFPLTSAEYAKLLLDAEHDRDVRTTDLLARDVLSKSAAVDDLVARLPGMGRTRAEQMERIEELIRDNNRAERELAKLRGKARKRREEVREALGGCTCAALGVEEAA